MINMTKKKVTFYVEGVDWTQEIDVDVEIFESPRELYLEAASRGLEEQMKVQKLNLGPVILVRKKGGKKEALVNSFMCLNNISQYELAQELRAAYMKKSDGQDLALDEQGYSF